MRLTSQFTSYATQVEHLSDSLERSQPGAVTAGSDPLRRIMRSSYVNGPYEICSGQELGRLALEYLQCEPFPLATNARDGHSLHGPLV